MRLVLERYGVKGVAIFYFQAPSFRNDNEMMNLIGSFSSSLPIITNQSLFYNLPPLDVQFVLLSLKLGFFCFIYLSIVFLFVCSKKCSFERLRERDITLTTGTLGSFIYKIIKFCLSRLMLPLFYSILCTECRLQHF